MRFIVLIALVVLAVWLIRRALRGPAGKMDVGKTATQANGGELVRCAHCGVHLPRAEARQAAGALYCSEEHARLGAR
jgi:uncharacterized protein